MTHSESGSFQNVDYEALVQRVENLLKPRSRSPTNNAVDLDANVERGLEDVKTEEHVDNYRTFILVIGTPGSGKTTIAKNLEKILNDKYASKGCKTIHQHPSQPLTGEILDSSISNLLPYTSDRNIPIEDVLFQPVVDKSHKDRIRIIGRGLTSSEIDILPANAILYPNQNTFAKTLSMDGFHLPLNRLKKFKDPSKAIKFRGAPFTFDSSMVLKLVELILNTCTYPITAIPNTAAEENMYWTYDQTSIPTITVPDFNHGTKDPVPGSSIISSSTRVIILEGNYLMLESESQWNKIPKLIKMLKGEGKVNVEVWKVHTDLEITKLRVAKRHLNAGVVDCLEDGIERFTFNDLPNGKLVLEMSDNQVVDLVVHN